VPQGAAREGAADVRSRPASAKARTVKREVIVSCAPKSVVTDISLET
jgi:hypothetical protein